MPRQGVPYPSREICSLKCQIDALQRQINELMKSVNGVEGDGQGNVSLISGDPAIVINSDQVQHEIEISLDSSQLPAAAVSSVNSQTGAVQLEADDIPSDGNSDVQADIDALKALGVNLQGAINNEVTARGNADAALQGNINTVQASIPGEAANAVANDPTVIQLATDVPNKLDKITSGSSLKAYTHTGATQGEKSVVDGTTADSIAIRDANGRLQAADPASGATDKTLVTANWVSQTGNTAPNNLAHRSGNETIFGLKNMQIPNNGGYRKLDMIASTSIGDWVRLIRFNGYSQSEVKIYAKTPNNGLGYGHVFIGGSDNYNRSYLITAKGIFAGMQFTRIAVNGYNELWLKLTSNTLSYFSLYIVQSTVNVETQISAAYNNAGAITDPTIGSTHPITGETITGVSVIT